jgi:hypothetical protein
MVIPMHVLGDDGRWSSFQCVRLATMVIPLGVLGDDGRPMRVLGDNGHSNARAL